MKSKLLVATALMTLVSTAATVTFNGIDANSNGATPAISGDTVTSNMSLTGDLDGLGLVDDTLSFDLVATWVDGTTWDGTTLSLGTTAGTAAVVAGLNWQDIGSGSSVTWTVTNISYNRGENSLNTVSFDGFDGSAFQAGGGGATHEVVLGVGTDVIEYDPSGTFSQLSNGSLTDKSSLTISHIQTISGSTSFGIRDIDFSFTVDDRIPEPSSAALLGLGGLVLLARRKR